MAKKVVVNSPAELEKVMREDEAAIEEAPVAKPKKKEEVKMATLSIPTLRDGRPVEIRIGGKLYTGTCVVPEYLVHQIKEMADKIIDREADITVGKKFQGAGNGNRGLRFTGRLS